MRRAGNDPVSTPSGATSLALGLKKSDLRSLPPVKKSAQRAAEKFQSRLFEVLKESLGVAFVEEAAPQTHKANVSAITPRASDAIGERRNIESRLTPWSFQG
jgi:hypothetical protein